MPPSKKKSESSSVAVPTGTPATPLERANAARKRIEKLTAEILKRTTERTELMNSVNAIQDMCSHSWGLPTPTADRSRVKVRCETCGWEKLVRRDSIKVTGL